MLLLRCGCVLLFSSAICFVFAFIRMNVAIISSTKELNCTRKAIERMLLSAGFWQYFSSSVLFLNCHAHSKNYIVLCTKGRLNFLKLFLKGSRENSAKNFILSILISTFDSLLIFPLKTCFTKSPLKTSYD